MLERIEQVLDEKVRPALRTHDGDIKVVRVEDGVLYFRMLGQCSNCPSAVVTAEELVVPPILEAIPEIKKPSGQDRTAAEWNYVAKVTRRRRRILP